MLGRSEMPLAEERGPISGRLEPIGHGRLAQRQSAVGPGIGAHVDLVAEPLLIAAGQQSGSRRAAVGTGDVAVGESNPGSRQRVDVRRGNVLAAVHADVGVPHVVSDDHHDVRLPGLRERRTGGGDDDREHASQNREPTSSAMHTILRAGI